MDDKDFAIRSEQRYAPNFCEENVWKLCKNFPRLNAKAVFISNIQRQCPMWYQRAAVEGSPIIWDYHVIFVYRVNDKWQVVDHDTTLAIPIDVDHYLSSSFPPRIAPDYQPLFKAIDSEFFLANFSSNRSHMKSRSGGFLQSPPSWSCIYNGVNENLSEFIDMKNERFGTIYTKDQFHQAYGMPQLNMET